MKFNVHDTLAIYYYINKATFIIYINDLSDNLSSQFTLYADDALLYTFIHTITDRHTLHIGFKCDTLLGPVGLMAYSPTKCEFLLCTFEHSLKHSQYYTKADYIGYILGSHY